MLSELSAWKDSEGHFTAWLRSSTAVEGYVYRLLENDDLVYIRSIYGDTNYVVKISDIVCISWQGAIDG